jgi:hypothetical protein
MRPRVHAGVTQRHQQAQEGERRLRLLVAQVGEISALGKVGDFRGVRVRWFTAEEM